jgi:SAM-dependent methyltransferase
MTDSNFQAYSEYYDLLYADKDYKAESEYILGLLSTHCVPAAGSMLELGCGTGAHAEFFAEKGWSVHGIDVSIPMLERAQRRAAASPHSARLKFELGDVRNFRADIRFDAIVSLFHVTSYQTTNTDLEAMFETAAQHLNPGGVFLFDFWYGPAVLWEKPTIRVKRVADRKTSVTRIAEPSVDHQQNIVNVDYLITVKTAEVSLVEISETHRIRYFFVPELDLMLQAKGFQIASCFEWLEQRPPSLNGWSTVLTAVKR